MTTPPLRTFDIWSEHKSRAGKVYYYNRANETSQWHKPQEWKDYDAKIERERAMADSNSYTNSTPVPLPPPIANPAHMNFMNIPPPHLMGFPGQSHYPQPSPYPPNGPFYNAFAPPPPPNRNPSVPQFSSSVPPPPLGSRTPSINGIPPPPPLIHPTPANDHFSSSPGLHQTPVVSSAATPNDHNITQSSSNRDSAYSSQATTSHKNNEGSMYKRELANLQQQQQNSNGMKNGNYKRAGSPINTNSVKKKTSEELNGSHKPKSTNSNNNNNIDGQGLTASTKLDQPQRKHRLPMNELLPFYDGTLAAEKMRMLGLCDEELRIEFRTLTRQSMAVEAQLNCELITQECARSMTNVKEHEVRIETARLDSIEKEIEELNTHKEVNDFSQTIEMTTNRISV